MSVALTQVQMLSATDLAQRQLLRQQIRQKRQLLDADAQQLASQQLLQQLPQLTELQTANHIAIYLSNDGELSTTSLVETLWRQGKQLYLPVLHPFCQGYLLFQRYSPTTPLQANKFGILEPKLNITELGLPTELDLIFMPLVAFDSSGQRLGMGGGFYDRTLAPLRFAKCSPLLVGLAHDCQQVGELPAAAWDVPLPAILSPSRLWRF